MTKLAKSITPGKFYKENKPPRITALPPGTYTAKICFSKIVCEKAANFYFIIEGKQDKYSDFMNLDPTSKYCDGGINMLNGLLQAAKITAPFDDDEILLGKHVQIVTRSVAGKDFRVVSEYLPSGSTGSQQNDLDAPPTYGDADIPF